jgi:hypothetical protein
MENITSAYDRRLIFWKRRNRRDDLRFGVETIGAVMAGLVPAIHVVTRLVVLRTRTLLFAADAALS